MTNLQEVVSKISDIIDCLKELLLRDHKGKLMHYFTLERFSHSLTEDEKRKLEDTQYLSFRETIDVLERLDGQMLEAINSLTLAENRNLMAQYWVSALNSTMERMPQTEVINESVKLIDLRNNAARLFPDIDPKLREDQYAIRKKDPIYQVLSNPQLIENVVQLFQHEYKTEAFKKKRQSLVPQLLDVENSTPMDYKLLQLPVLVKILDFYYQNMK